MDEQIKKKYYDLNYPYAYSGNLKKLMELNPNAKKWLATQPAYTLHRSVKRKFPTRKYRTSTINHQWQTDLVDMQAFKKQNRGYAYILTAIDLFSRYAYAVPLKSKAHKDVINGFKHIFKKAKPNLLQSDQGKEFESKHIQEFFKKNNVKQFSVMSQYKAAIVERFHRTLRGRMYRYFTKNGTRKWFNILQLLIDGYNNSSHSYLNGLAPSQVTKENAMQLWDERNTITKKHVKSKLKVGDFVRLAKVKKTFDHGYTPNWTEEIFQIMEIDARSSPIMYVVKDLESEETVKGKFYYEELQKVDNVFRIEKILKTKTQNGVIHYYVKWLGYKNPSWIKKSDLV